MSTITRRLTAALTSGLLAVTLATAPASALRLVPVDPDSTSVAEVEPADDPSLLLTQGRLSRHTGAETQQDAGSSSPESRPTKAQVEHEERAAAQDVVRPTKAQIEHEERSATAPVANRPPE